MALRDPPKATQIVSSLLHTQAVCEQPQSRFYPTADASLPCTFLSEGDDTHVTRTIEMC